MPNRYAICIRIGSSRLYWNNLTRRWTAFNFATQFSAAERKQVALPKDAFWVSVLHGFGKDSSYPADSELSSTPRDKPSSAAATHGTTGGTETAREGRQPTITNKGKKRGEK